MGSFCSWARHEESSQVDETQSGTHRQRRLTETISDSSVSSPRDSSHLLEEENRKLNSQLLEMKQQLASQLSENASLQVRVLSLQKSLSNASPCSNEEPIPSTNVLSRPSQSMEAFPKTVHNEDKIQTIQSVRETFKTVQTVTDVSSFVNKAYKTADFGWSDEEELESNPMDNTYFINETETERESSVDSEEQLEIDKAKQEEIEKQRAEEEMMAMKMEMSAMQRSLTDQDILLGKGTSSNEYVAMKPIVQTTSDDLELPESNLFRFESDQKWNETAVHTQKKEMEAAMTSLLQYYKDSSERGSEKSNR